MYFKKKCKVKYVENEPSVDSININLDTDMAEWLKKIGDSTIMIEWSSEYLYLAGLRSISLYQKNYIGEGWESSWIVFATWIGDPVIYDTQSKEILTSMHGVGKWNPYLIAPSLSKFDLILSIWCSLYYDKYNGKIHDDNFELLQSFTIGFKREIIRNNEY